MIEGEDLDDRPKPDHVAAAKIKNAIVPGRWVDPGDLRVGDILLLRDGHRLSVEEVELRQVHEPVSTFMVAGLRNYAVGNGSAHKKPINLPSAKRIDINIDHRSRFLARPGMILLL